VNPQSFLGSAQAPQTKNFYNINTKSYPEVTYHAIVAAASDYWGSTYRGAHLFLFLSRPRPVLHTPKPGSNVFYFTYWVYNDLGFIIPRFRLQKNPDPPHNWTYVGDIRGDLIRVPKPRKFNCYQPGVHFITILGLFFLTVYLRPGAALETPRKTAFHRCRWVLFRGLACTGARGVPDAQASSRTYRIIWIPRVLLTSFARCGPKMVLTVFNQITFVFNPEIKFNK
jgi:hypothetical protein